MSRTSLSIAIAACALFAGYGEAAAQARGSYLNTCTEVEQQGSFLSALCLDVRGRLIPSSLDLRACPNRRVANLNGRLRCESRERSRFHNDRRYGRQHDRDYYPGYGGGGYDEDDFRDTYYPRRREYYVPY